MTSVFIALLAYYLLLFSIDRIEGGLSSFSEIVQWMFLFAAFGFIIVIPALALITYISYQVLTKKGIPSKKNKRRNRVQRSA